MAIIEVFPGSPTAMQDAVAAASEGDVIVVHCGVYHEDVQIPSGKNNIRIVSKRKHCAILDGRKALHEAFALNGVLGVEIEGFRIKNYRGAGIRIVNGKSHRILNNHITDIRGVSDPFGIFAGHTPGNLLTRNLIERIGSAGEGTGAGIRLNAVSGNWAVHNRIQHNAAHGIEVIDSLHNAIAGNRISRNKGEGILVTGSDNQLILDNKLHNNKGNGVHARSTNNLIVTSTIKGNGDNGLLFAANYNFAGFNEIKDNDHSGIQIASGFNDVQGNAIQTNSDNGVFLRKASTSNFVFDNDFLNNQPRNVRDRGTNNDILLNEFNEQ